MDAWVSAGVSSMVSARGFLRSVCNFVLHCLLTCSFGLWSPVWPQRYSGAHLEYPHGWLSRYPPGYPQRGFFGPSATLSSTVCSLRPTDYDLLGDFRVVLPAGSQLECPLFCSVLQGVLQGCLWFCPPLSPPIVLWTLLLGDLKVILQGVIKSVHCSP